MFSGLQFHIYLCISNLFYYILSTLTFLYLSTFIMLFSRFHFIISIFKCLNDFVYIIKIYAAQAVLFSELSCSSVVGELSGQAQI